MTKITKEEVLKIATLSHIAIHDDEIEPIMQHLQSVLTYAERVQQIAGNVENNLYKQVNVFREDVIIPTNPEPILDQAPEREDHFFVVPRIIESNQ
jgi:aspartyl-tRNA(Asn)/glutamyl-tRNA(Gln) amidotransferase subunit C